jgi:hypothetical protein
MSSRKPRYVVERDWRGPYVRFVPLGTVRRTFTERGAIRKAKRLNQPPVRIWPKEDES